MLFRAEIVNKDSECAFDAGDIFNVYGFIADAKGNTYAVVSADGCEGMLTIFIGYLNPI